MFGSVYPGKIYKQQVQRDTWSVRTWQVYKDLLNDPWIFDNVDIYYMLPAQGFGLIHILKLLNIV